MMKTIKYYTCEYCHKEYIPKRRGVQKYCSNSCRSNACRVRNQEKTITSKTDSIIPLIESNQQKDQMSLSGVGNATAGAILANTLKSAFTKEDNKPATKGDIKIMTEKLRGRYHLVKNMEPNLNGEQPYFDLQENIVIYFSTADNIFH